MAWSAHLQTITEHTVISLNQACNNRSLPCMHVWSSFLHFKVAVAAITDVDTAHSAAGSGCEISTSKNMCRQCWQRAASVSVVLMVISLKNRHRTHSRLCFRTSFALSVCHSANIYAKGVHLISHGHWCSLTEREGKISPSTSWRRDWCNVSPQKRPTHHTVSLIINSTIAGYWLFTWNILFIACTFSFLFGLTMLTWLKGSLSAV